MVKLQASSAPMGNKEAMQASCHADNDNREEGATTDNMDPSRPFLYLEKFDVEKMREWSRLRSAWLAKSKPNDIIIPDPTPQRVIDAFYNLCSHLGPILEKDSVQCFLRLFVKKAGMRWDHAVTSQTLTFLIIYNALQCAKAVLEGKEPELNGKRANPNCINPYGYFPLHEAAQKFSVDMIKLLFCHGASANVRTVGDVVIAGLLPLHVAVENTCLHKYLEDNLFPPTKDHQDYIYKLITLLCLPEMKIFLDTVRLLAEETDNIVDEIWNYIKDEKLVQTAVLLLAAQKQIREDCTSEINVNGKQSGLDIIVQRIVDRSLSLGWKKGENGETQQELEESVTFNHSALLLVRIISRAGEVLDAYIQGHSEVPHVAHVEILKHVSCILEEFGFCPVGEVIDVKNLRPYDCKKFDRVLHDQGHVNATTEVTETAYLHAAEEKAVRKKLPVGWDPAYRRRMFLPYWRSVLGARCRVRLYPPYAPADASKELDPERLRSWINSISNGSSVKPNHNLGPSGRTPELASNHQFKRPFGTAAFTGNGSSRIPNHNLSLLGRIRQPASNHQSRRLFGTAAFTLLKVLKNA
ncbi:uncharacterized protein LOC133901739 [Phragmites australis]|uniref:uncharacterized protein LOC133901739 n=1 Tax=Phragmites australis TaxID=29695 RepID=UPI002D774615|nr:uncharacterized protein LOC133901739 [Phragmites australis]